MRQFVLFCKSFRNDVLRLKLLAESVQKFNEECIDFYVSVPRGDKSLFDEALKGLPVILITDEEIVSANSALVQSKIDSLRGGLSQQIIKSEFWRLGLAESYLCLDSDCVFIRPFGEADFIASEGGPYTVIHEGKDFLQFARLHGMEKIGDYFFSERYKMMDVFERTGRVYDYGPAPLLWNRSVWAALDSHFLKPRGMSFYDAILLHPSEILWYGEAMLRYRPIPLIPAEPFFKVYLYERQFIVGRKRGETKEILAENYLGVGYQSNWDTKLDYIKKPFLSRVVRWMKRHILRKDR